MDFRFWIHSSCCRLSTPLTFWVFDSDCLTPASGRQDIVSGFALQSDLKRAATEAADCAFSGSLKCKRHCLEIKGRFVCLLQEVYAEISVKEFAGFDSVRQQDRRRAQDYWESPDA